MDFRVYKAILKTICYADIFDYPLKKEEVEKWIKDIRILRYSDIKKANGVIQHKQNFMFLKDREELIATRNQRETISEKKLAIVRRIRSILRYVPTVKLIGLSGSVAAGNAARDADIDLFIITEAGTLWLTRLLTTIVAELLGNRRRPSDVEVSDKICLNMFIDEKFLTIPRDKHNLYTAHEVCQLKVLYDRDGTYNKFLLANVWVRKFLPNAIAKSKEQRAESKNRKLYALSSLLYAAEWFAKHLQLWYMNGHRTREVISDHYLAFHPKDYTNDILTALEKRMRLYGSKV